MASREVMQMPAADLELRWQGHIDLIEEEVRYFSTRQRWFRELNRMFVDNTRLRDRRGSWTAFGWLSSMWITEAMMCVRREVDGQYGAVNLVHLFHEMEARPDAFIHIPREEVADDRATLVRETRDVVKHAQVYLAHRMPVGTTGTSYSEVEAALAAIRHMAGKYHELVYGHAIDADDTTQDDEWLDAFKVRWYAKPRRWF
jgi:hypothetical protein